MIRVVLVDDQEVVRAGFALLLERHPDISVVGQAASGPEGVAVVRRENPDVVCMDLRMPGGDGLTATRRITSEREGDKSAVLVLTTFNLDADVFGALEAGADGFILKDCRPNELAEAIRRLARGEGLLDQSVTRRVIAEFGRRKKPENNPNALRTLTERELDIVRLVAQGMTNQEIADELIVERTTVKSHIARILPKIDARDRVQMAIWAYRNGVVE